MTTGFAKFGWGLPNDTVEDRFYKEATAFEQLANAAPQLLIRHAPKPVVDSTLFQKIRNLHALDGIEEGYCTDYIHEAIDGKPVKYLPQLIGSCVASGDFRNTADRIRTEVFLLNEPETVLGVNWNDRDNIAPFAPYSYRAGRKIARINGMGDGSLCVPHIQGKLQYGILPCWAKDKRGNEIVSDAFPEPQSMTLYRQWGANDTLLESFSDVGKTFLQTETEKVTTVEQVCDLLTIHFKPMNICSMWAFKSREKHPTWKYRDGSPVYIWARNRSDEWAHNMSINGFALVSGNRFYKIRNSWGDYHNKRDHFWITEDELELWLKEAEVQSVGDIDLVDSIPVWNKP